MGVEKVAEKVRVPSCSFSLITPIHVKDDEEMVTMFETALLGDIGYGSC